MKKAVTGMGEYRIRTNRSSKQGLPNICSAWQQLSHLGASCRILRQLSRLAAEIAPGSSY
jgi:hypothetical protein